MSWQLVHPFHIGFLPPDIWYTLTFGTPWQLVHPDIWYTLTTGTPWQLVHPDIWYTLTFGTPRHLVHPDIWYTLTTCIVLFIVNLFIGLITTFPYLYVGEVLSGRGGGVLRGLCAQSHGFGSPQMTGQAWVKEDLELLRLKCWKKINNHFASPAQLGLG